VVRFNPTPLALPVLIVSVALLILALSIRRIRRVGRLPHRNWRRVTERVLLSLVVLVCVAATLTATYNVIAQRYYQSIYKAPGRLYEVGGYRMHLYCTGEGAPTLVLETGWTLRWGGAQCSPSCRKQPRCARTIARATAGANHSPGRGMRTKLLLSSMPCCSRLG
jgi:hypothetical protein